MWFHKDNSNENNYSKRIKGNIYNLLDEVLNTGIPLEINKEDKKLKIMSMPKANKLKNLVSRPDVIKGKPDDLVDIRAWFKKAYIKVTLLDIIDT